MASAYPGALDTFTTKTDLEDLVDDDHMNEVQNSIVAIETELGTDPAGTTTDVKTRLAVSLADSGAIQSGTSNPGSPVVGQPFFRTDLLAFQIWDGSAWVTAGNFSNVIWRVQGDSSRQDYVNAINLTTTTTEYEYYYVGQVSNNNFGTGAETKFLKFNGVNTLTFYCKMWTQDTANWRARLTVDVLTGNTATFAGTLNTPAWSGAGTVDVSSLSDGTLYDMSIAVGHTNGGTNRNCWMSDVVVFGS